MERARRKRHNGFNAPTGSNSPDKLNEEAPAEEAPRSEPHSLFWVFRDDMRHPDPRPVETLPQRLRLTLFKD